MTLTVRRLDGAAVFGIFLTAVLWVSVSRRLATPLELLRLGLLFVLFLAIRTLFMKRVASPTGSGAIVMAAGIFVNGAIIHFPFLNNELGRPSALVLFILLLFIAFSYCVDAVQGNLFLNHFENHVGCFAVGTWVAGASVCGIAICQRLPDWQPLVRVLVVGNFGLWLAFICRAAVSFKRFFVSGDWRKVHGVLFLSTVSTQSLVIVWKVAFGASALYLGIAPWGIFFGVILYFLSFYLVVRRYAWEGAGVDLDKGWFNTNCITHGAMSITGLASAVSGVVPPDLTLLIWLWAISWFVIIEAVELVRATRRVKLHGVAEGLFVYDPTQWSRNFTFGMLYAFTLNFDLAASRAAGTFLQPLRQAILAGFGWVVLGLLLVEICIFLRDRLSLAAPGA